MGGFAMMSAVIPIPKVHLCSPIDEHNPWGFGIDTLSESSDGSPGNPEPQSTVDGGSESSSSNAGHVGSHAGETEVFINPLDQNGSTCEADQNQQIVKIHKPPQSSRRAAKMWIEVKPNAHNSFFYMGFESRGPFETAVSGYPEELDLKQGNELISNSGFEEDFTVMVSLFPLQTYDPSQDYDFVIVDNTTGGELASYQVSSP